MNWRTFLTASLVLGVIVSRAHGRDEMPATASYRPAEVLLTGKLVRRVYPGPPEYESISKGDAREEVLILKLDHPIDVKYALFPDYDQLGVREIQVGPLLNNDETQERSLRHLLDAAVGYEVVAMANLWPAENAHHRTPVMGDIFKINTKAHATFRRSRIAPRSKLRRRK